MVALRRVELPETSTRARIALFDVEHDVLEPDVAPAIHLPLAGGDQSACDSCRHS
jgi:hypothetical protein